MASSWIRRLGTKRSGFRIQRQGRHSRSADTGRIVALRVPPAWRDVQIASTPRSAIQALGFDARRVTGTTTVRWASRAAQVSSRDSSKDLPRIRRALHATRLSARVDARRGLSRRRCSVSSAKRFARGGERYAKENGVRHRRCASRMSTSQRHRAARVRGRGSIDRGRW